jgi:peptide deformylase
MIYPIFVYGNSVLRKKAKEIERDFEGLGDLIRDMRETMAVSDGVGLAAPQIGKSLRIFIIDGSEMEVEDEPELKTFQRVFINPIILEETGDPWTFNEGCLSLPTLREDVIRKNTIRIQYYDENWNFRDELLTGVRARITQHEYDHLEGILFIDRINPLRKRLINGKLNAISKGKVDVDYKLKLPPK